MKQIFIFVLLVLTFSGCKKEENQDPLPEIKTIVGKWRLDAYERIVNGEKVWEKVTGEPSYLSFRFDGVILGKDGLPTCCAPTSFTLNGILFNIVPKAKLPENPQCALVDCYSCPIWEMEQNEDQLILSYCIGPSRARYIRE